MAAKARCPECGAMLAGGADWCPQCYTDLREPEPARLPDADGTAGPEAVALRARHRPARSDDADEPPPGWPCPACRTVNDLAADVCAGCGSGFLAPLAEERGVPVVPGFSSLSRSGRLGVTLLGLVVVLGLLAGAVWLAS
jgi:hypothetical protein